MANRSLAVAGRWRVRRWGWRVWGALLALAALAAPCYLAASFDTFPGDERALLEFQGFRNAWLDDAAVVASSMAKFYVALFSVIGMSILLWTLRRRGDAVIAFLVLVPEGINLLLKEIIDRPRPEFSLLAHLPENPAFPSGHSVHAFLLFGLLIVLAGEIVSHRWARLSIQGVLVLMILSVGASRVYLGVHWPSDVVGGFLVGLASLVGLLWLRKLPRIRSLQHKGLAVSRDRVDS